MKNNNKFRLDVWGAITLGTIALYALFLLYPMAYLIRPVSYTHLTLPTTPYV